jgi:hypothetical protein
MTKVTRAKVLQTLDTESLEAIVGDALSMLVTSRGSRGLRLPSAGAAPLRDDRTEELSCRWDRLQPGSFIIYPSARPTLRAGILLRGLFFSDHSSVGASVIGYLFNDADAGGGRPASPGLRSIFRTLRSRQDRESSGARSFTHATLWIVAQLQQTQKRHGAGC